MTDLKTRETTDSPDVFIGRVESARQRDEAREIVTWMTELSDCPPRMWGPSIIGFGQYHYRYESGREGDMPRLAFSPRKGNTVFYINGGFENYAEIMDRLGKYKTGKGCLYVRSLADVDKAALVELLRSSLQFMDMKYPR
ncbi:MAG: DUF1801 domain-containing protein [Sphingomonadales bacterium]|nr:DUF1801 domain-containing protein [Sphingomonadales bacterium]